MAYTYDPIFAQDPNNPNVVASNATITIYNPADASKAPIAITDASGSPLPNPIKVDGRGMGPAFQHPTLDRVAWTGGGFQNFFTSYEGMKNETTAAKEAAQSAADTASAAAAEVVTAAAVNGSGKLILTKANGATQDAGSVIGPVGPKGDKGLDGANVLPTDDAIEQAIKTTGTKTATALSATYEPKGAAAAAAPPTYSISAWTPGSKVLPLAADKTRVFGIGSSSMGNMRTEFEDALAGQTWGATYTNWAEAGERFEHALARAGIINARLTFPSNTIPASGAVTVGCDLPTLNFMRTYTGTVEGVSGTLSLASGVFTFTRSTAGTAVTTNAGAEFAPALTVGGTPQFPAFRDAVGILDLGKNNAVDAGSSDRVNAALDLLVEWLVPKVKTYIVIGQFADTNGTLAQKQNVARVNAYRAANYGTRFVDLQAYVTGSQIWTDTGITPTTADLDQQAKGEKPSSLSSDDLHLNATAELAVVNKLIMPKLASAMGRVFYGPNPVVTSDAFTGGNMSNINGRVTDATLGGEQSSWTANTYFGTVTNGQFVAGTATAMGALPVTTANVEFTIKVTTLPTAGSIIAQARAKQNFADQNNDAYRATLAAGGSLVLERRAATVTSVISTGSYAASAGDTIGVRAVGNQISLLKNGAVLQTVTDSGVTNGGWAGVAVVGSTGSAFDDVKLRYITDASKL